MNELSLLTLLRTQGTASRAQIARRLSLTPATITRLVVELARRGLVREVPETPRDGAAREVGRPGVGVALDPGGAYFLGVEIGVGVLRYALLDLTASVVDSSEVRVSRSITPRQAVAAIAEHVVRLRRNPRYQRRIRSVGVTVPGLVTSEGYVVHLPILGWKHVALLELLGGAVRLPCTVENNANAAAFGAVYTTPSTPSACTVFLKLGTGCGGAAIINGRLLRGCAGTAGEFGHLRVNDRGPTCNCGQVGCLESWANLSALARSFRGTDRMSVVELAALPEVVAQAAEAGHPRARKAIESLSHHVALGLVSLVNVFNPDTILLGGVMRPVIERCLDAIRAGLAAGIVPGTTVPEVRLSAHGVLECAIGAASIAHHRAFDLSRVDLAEPELRP